MCAGGAGGNAVECCRPACGRHARNVRVRRVGARAAQGPGTSRSSYSRSHVKERPFGGSRRTLRRWPMVVAAVIAVGVGVVVAVVVTGSSNETMHVRHLRRAPWDTYRSSNRARVRVLRTVAMRPSRAPHSSCLKIVVFHGARRSVFRLCMCPRNMQQALPEITVGPSAPPASTDLAAVADQNFLTMRGSAGAAPSLTCKEESDHRRRAPRIGFGYGTTTAVLRT